MGREGDTDYLVMELVEGETLAQRLEKGALPAAEVLKLGAQIADALDRAHRAGVAVRFGDRMQVLVSVATNRRPRDIRLILDWTALVER